MQFHHTQAVVEAFPDHYTGIIANVSVHDKDVLVEKTQHMMAAFDKDAALLSGAVSRWQMAFQKMGAKSKYAPSLQALKQFYDTNNKIYAISPIVDFYNAYCLCHNAPMAAYDVAHVQGDMTLRYAAKDEPFVPLGAPKQTEKTKNGEIIYADDEKVMCRYWNLQDCHATRITDDTRNIVFVFDLLDGEDFNVHAQWAKIHADFKGLFGEGIFGGLTGKTAQSSLAWGV
ncbi:MAG: phenylalanine--tRNA ligase beta subunit-related protein [Alphaproteobacteria bacterium]|nr:phenylalanine--tRNA ligase beta subunit-related protein [Alphaproteobacteria bacterium]